MDLRPARRIGLADFLLLLSYFLIAVGIALSNRCDLPIIPTDLFPRELSDILEIGYPKVKIAFDVICLAVTAGADLLLFGPSGRIGHGHHFGSLHHRKAVGLVGEYLDKRVRFLSILTQRRIDRIKGVRHENKSL